MESTFENVNSTNMLFADCVISSTPDRNNFTVFTVDNLQGLVYQSIYDRSTPTPAATIVINSTLLQATTFGASGVSGVEFFQRNNTPFLLLSVLGGPGDSTFYTLDLSNPIDVTEVNGVRRSDGVCMATSIRFWVGDSSTLFNSCQGNNTNVDPNFIARVQGWKSNDGWVSALEFIETVAPDPFREFGAVYVGQIGSNFYFLTNSHYSSSDDSFLVLAYSSSSPASLSVVSTFVGSGIIVLLISQFLLQ